MNRDTPMTGSGDGTIPRVNSLETLKILYCYTRGIGASLFAFVVCSAFISTLYYSYFRVYSAPIASFNLMVDKALSQQAKVAPAATMLAPEAAQSERTQEIQRRNRGAM